MNITKHRLTDTEIKLVFTSGERGKIGVGDSEAQTTMYKVSKLQGYIVQYREIQPIFYNNFKWNIIYKNIESLCCIPETNIVNQLYFNEKMINKYQGCNVQHDKYN